jgi:HK97 gp10 family phage protein
MAIDTKLDWFGEKEKSDMNDAMIRFLIRGTNLVQAAAKQNLTQNKSVDTGNLRSSVVKAVEKSKLIGTVSTNVEYAQYVEFGLRSNPNYPKNPYMRPALNDNVDKLNKIAILEGKKSVNN